MKIHCGSTRIVLLFGSFVLKFPRIIHLLVTFKSLSIFALRGNWKILPVVAKRGWYWFYKGIRQNITERSCWKSCHAPFLVPTFLSLGFVNIQKREKGEEPSLDEMNTFIHKMGRVSKNQVYTIYPHCFSPKNFLKNGSGLRVLDYGDSSYQPLRFTHYIMRWHKELSEILCVPK